MVQQTHCGGENGKTWWQQGVGKSHSLLLLRLFPEVQEVRAKWKFSKKMATLVDSYTNYTWHNRLFRLCYCHCLGCHISISFCAEIALVI